MNLKLDHANSDLMETQIKEERAAAAIKELQDKLIEAKNDRKDMEIDYIGVKKNYWQVKMQYDSEKQKAENLAVELVNLVNENKALQREVSVKERNYGETNQNKQYLEEKNSRFENELQEARL